MKIYVICDLEGIAGVADQAHQCSFTHDEYETDYVPGHYGPFYLQARRLATLELNALVEGALAGGATEVVAWDGHCRFPGGLDVELLHPECKLVMNAGDGGPVGFDATFDALMLHGAHAKKGTPAASQAHMLFPGLEWNGAEIGEIGMNIALAGEFEVPVIFVSGDLAAVREAQAFVPDLETVVVKEALFTHAAGIFEHAPEQHPDPVATAHPGWCILQQPQQRGHRPAVGIPGRVRRRRRTHGRRHLPGPTPPPTPPLSSTNVKASHRGYQTRNAQRLRRSDRAYAR